MAYTAKQKTFRKRETKEEFAARKKAEKEEAYEMIDRSITEMMQQDGSFINYLDFQAKMDRYTPSNAILIKAQRPQATQLKSGDVWHELGVKINKGEKGVHILEPSEYVDENGEARTSYNVKNVFDVSQTDAEVQPAPAVEHNAQALVKAMLSSTALEKTAVDEIPDSTAYYDNESNTLLVKKKSDSVSLFQDISRELSLAVIAEGCDKYNREECLPSAVCASYMLCKKYGVDNRNIDVRSAKAQWQGKENKEVRTMLTMANDALYSVGKDIYVQLQKDKEKAKTAPER